MTLPSDTNHWVILGISASLCGIGSLVYSRTLLKSAPSRRWALPLAAVAGLRTSVLGTSMIALVLLHGICGTEGFAMYDEHGDLSLVFRLRELSIESLAIGVLALPLEVIYMLVAHLRGVRGFWGTGFGLMVPFAVLAVFYLMGIGMFVPMV